MKQLIAVFVALFLVGAVAVAQEQTEKEKQESEQTEQEQETVEPKEGEAQEPKEGELEGPQPQEKVQWSEMFRAWSTTHYLHIDYTHPETGEWCAVLIIENRTQAVQCIK